MTVSIRSRLLLGIIGGMILLLAAFGLTVYGAIHRALLDQFDASLLSTARMLAASVRQEDGKIELELDAQQMPEFQNADKPGYFEIWQDDGQIVAKSPLLGTSGLPHFYASAERPVFKALTGPQGHRQRAVALKFLARCETEDRLTGTGEAPDKSLFLVVSRDAGGLHHQFHLVQWLLWTASGGTIGMSVLVALLVVGQGLRPLNAIAAEIGSIRENRLTSRIGTSAVPAEIMPIGNRLNDLLSRLEEAFNRERRFTADVAHELRTPLAGMHSTIEVAQSRTRDIAEYQRVLSECLTMIESMERMVHNLLMIVRFDACQVTFCRRQIRLAETLDLCWRPLRGRAFERKILFENQINDELTCESDPDNLSTVLSNILDNAVEYANEGGRIWTGASQTHDSVEITIANTGCQLSAEQVTHVFDSFWRGDSTRTETGVHCGLGLAIAQRIVRAMQGSITAGVEQGGIFIITLTLLSASGQRDTD